MEAITFAIDRASARRMDQDGRLHVELTNISKATVNGYMGREIPLAGLEPDKIYQVFRDPAALAASCPTFDNIPLLDTHIIVTADDPKKSRIVGSTGTDATFVDGYLKNSLVVWDAAAIARIESGVQKEISCAYRYVATLKSGVFEGLPYSIVMGNIVANHVALVKEGRAGPDVVVADSKPRDAEMKFTAIKGKLAAKFATDSALKSDRPYLFLALDAMEEEVEAEDADPDEEDCETKVKDKAKDMKAEDEAETAAEEKKAADKKAKDKAAKDKAAKDAENDPPARAEDSDDDDDEKEKAMDAAISSRVKLATDAAITAYAASRDALDVAKTDVAPLVGTVHGMDSANAVYRFALDSAKIDHKDIKETAALRAMVRMVPKAGSAPVVAMDSKSRDGVVEMFPGLGRYA